jgi:hypothetical protein
VSDREHAERLQCVLVEASPFFGEVFKPIEVKPATGVPRKPFKLNDMIPDGHSSYQNIRRRYAAHE